MAASQKKEAATSSISVAAGADSASSLLSSSSKDKEKKKDKDKDSKKRNYSSMATDDHQPLKRPKTPSSTPSPSTAWGRLGELPNDILILILQKLLLQDHLRLSCVSVPWNLAVRGGVGGGHDDHPSSPKPQLPWLMISGAGQHHTSAKFISLSEHRTYDIPLPHPPIRERICIGSSHGWLITLHNFSEMHLLNPITGIQVSLPAITSTTTAAAATTYPSGYIRTGPRNNFSHFFGKAILSSAPAKDGTGDFTIILIHQLRTSSCRTLSIARIGDDAWTTFANEHFFDIIYHKGQLLLMGMLGCIHIWEHQQNDHHLSRRFSIDTKQSHHNNIPLEFTYNEIICSRNHLVQFTTGELFMLIRTENVISNFRTRFQIARLDLDRNEYIPVDDIKDLVFFVGINDSIIVSATKFPEVKRNCVYFTQHYTVCG